MRVSNWGKVTSGLFVCVLAGCGGGHGSGYGGAPMNPAPTVSFSQPGAAATINFGQATTLTWTSAYTTSCTATTSSAAGGSFTGTQMTSGSMTVVPTAAGNYTYTLSCTGSGGTKSASASVTVTTNILNALAPPAGTAIATVGLTGSTTDPTQGYNPYGLVVAPATAGLIAKGDLVVCNFNAGGNPNQGSGMNIVGLHPLAGSTPSTPYPIASSPDLLACNALTMLPDDSISAAAWSAAQNPNPLVSASGVVGTAFSSDTFAQPWGEAYVAATATQPAAIYVSNAPGGTTNAGSKVFDIYPVGIDNNLFISDSGTQKVAPFHLRDHEDTGCGFQVQMLESGQQRQHFPSVPVLPHPNFRPVVFKEQRQTGAQAGANACPAKASIALVDQINRRVLDLTHRACRKD